MLRPLSYPASDVFLLCFSLISATSLANVVNKWAPELRAFDARNGTKTPIVLIGTKADVRQDASALLCAEMKNAQHVSTEVGLATSRKLGCDAYIECSALTQDGLKKAFDQAIACALRKKMAER